MSFSLLLDKLNDATPLLPTINSSEFANKFPSTIHDKTSNCLLLVDDNKLYTGISHSQHHSNFSWNFRGQGDDGVSEFFFPWKC